MAELETQSALTGRIKDFLMRYKDASGSFKYVDEIDSSSNLDSILLHTQDFITGNVEDGNDLFQTLMKQPKRFLTSAKNAVNEIYLEHGHNKNKEYAVRIDNVKHDKEITINDATGKKLLGKIITLNGSIVSRTSTFNMVKKGVFTCPDGHDTLVESIDELLQSKPLTCSNSQCRLRNLEIDPDRSNFEQHRTYYIKSDNDVTGNNEELMIDVTGDMINILETGDKCTVTGILQTQQMTKNGKTTNVYRNYLKCVNLVKTDHVDLHISPDDEDYFKRLPEEPDFYEKMINSVSPDIIGNTDVKESLLLVRIGSPKIVQDGGKTTRGHMHIACFGDGGTAKSKFGEWQAENIPQTQLVMSKGATEKGLLLGLEDGHDGRKILRSGAMVNCRDGGMVIIEEMPRTPQETLDGLYTTMENGKASISKTGFQAETQADASIMANGNAQSGEWQFANSVKDNTGLDTAFLQRFDFIWLFKDSYSKKHDERIADAILDGTSFESEVSPLSPHILAKYIKYVRQINPKLTPEVTSIIKNAWLELRQDDKAKENGISARQLETIMRTTLAIARLYQRTTTIEEDAFKAIQLVKKMFEQHGISISSSDTYVERCFKIAIEVLENQSLEGITTPELSRLMLIHGEPDIQRQTRADLQLTTEHECTLTNNRRFREVVNALKRAKAYVEITSHKPLKLASRNDAGNISNW